MQSQIKSQLFRYLVVGGITAVLYSGIVILCVEVLRLQREISVSIGYFGAVFFHFNANRFFTFDARRGPVKTQVVRYVLLTMFNYCLTLLIVWGLGEWLGLPYFVSIFFSIGATVISGFVASKLWVFAKRAMDVI